MKSKIAILFLFGSLLFMSGCGIHSGYVGHQIETQVVLQRNNFRIVKNVEGSASATYILGIGGLAKKTLAGNAMAKLREAAGLTGSQALVNVTTNTKVANFGVFVRITVTVTGDVVEFTE